MLNNVIDLILPVERSICVNSALRAEAYESRAAYRLYVKGYISALRDLGFAERCISQLYDDFMNNEDLLFIDDFYEKTCSD